MLTKEQRGGKKESLMGSGSINIIEKVERAIVQVALSLDPTKRKRKTKRAKEDRRVRLLEEKRLRNLLRSPAGRSWGTGGRRHLGRWAKIEEKKSRRQLEERKP